MNAFIARSAYATDSWLKFALILLSMVLVLSTTWQVVSRYLLGDPSSWTEELARFALIWAGLLGAVYAYRTHAHIGIDVLTRKLSERNRAVLEVFSALCVIAFALSVAVVGGTNLVLIAAMLEQTSAALGWKMAWVYSVVPISGLLLVWYAVVQIANPRPRFPAGSV